MYAAASTPSGVNMTATRPRLGLDSLIDAAGEAAGPVLLRRRLPAAFAPFLQVRAFRAEGGVVAVPGIDPRRVGQSPEDALFQAAHQAVEVLRCQGTLENARWRS